MTVNADFPDDRELWAMARRLRHDAHAELAAEIDAAERAQEELTDLTARSLRAMMEGERWGLSVGEWMIEAHVVHVGGNFVQLEDPTHNIHDLIYDALGPIRVVGVDPKAGTAPATLWPSTMRGRLLGLVGCEKVELNGWRSAQPWSLVGTIESVNQDYLRFTDTSLTEVVVPLGAIDHVVRRPSRGRRNH